jgi:hypothetical protein
MSIRTIAGATAATAALLALPAAASARPDTQVDTGPWTAPAPAQAEAPSSGPLVIHSGADGGTDTLTVLILAGGTLLVGAAGGFGSGMVVTRRQAQAARP